MRRYLTPTLSDGATRDKDSLRMGVKKKSTRLSTGRFADQLLCVLYRPEGKNGLGHEHNWNVGHSCSK